MTGRAVGRARLGRDRHPGPVGQVLRREQGLRRVVVANRGVVGVAQLRREAEQPLEKLRRPLEGAGRDHGTAPARGAVARGGDGGGLVAPDHALHRLLDRNRGARIVDRPVQHRRRGAALVRVVRQLDLDVEALEGGRHPEPVRGQHLRERPSFLHQLPGGQREAVLQVLDEQRERVVADVRLVPPKSKPPLVQQLQLEILGRDEARLLEHVAEEADHLGLRPPAWYGSVVIQVDTSSCRPAAPLVVTLREIVVGDRHPGQQVLDLRGGVERGLRVERRRRRGHLARIDHGRSVVAARRRRCCRCRPGRWAHRDFRSRRRRPRRRRRAPSSANGAGSFGSRGSVSLRGLLQSAGCNISERHPPVPSKKSA